MASSDESPLNSPALNLEYMNKLPRELKEGYLESLRLQVDENATKEEMIAHVEEQLREGGGQRGSDVLLIKVLSALMDYSIWFREQLRMQNPTMQEYYYIVNRQSRDENFLALSVEGKRDEERRATAHLDMTQEDRNQNEELNNRGIEKTKEFKIEEFMTEYAEALVKERETPQSD